jgi:hypothetical protein
MSAQKIIYCINSIDCVYNKQCDLNLTDEILNQIEETDEPIKFVWDCEKFEENLLKEN